MRNNRRVHSVRVEFQLISIMIQVGRAQTPKPRPTSIEELIISLNIADTRHKST